MARDGIVNNHLLFRYELKSTFGKIKWFLLVPLLVALQNCLVLSNHHLETPEALDFFKRFLEGMEPMSSMAGSREPFLIPGDWIIVMVVFLYLISKVLGHIVKGSVCSC